MLRSPGYAAPSCSAYKADDTTTRARPCAPRARGLNRAFLLVGALRPEVRVQGAFSPLAHLAVNLSFLRVRRLAKGCVLKAAAADQLIGLLIKSAPICSELAQLSKAGTEHVATHLASTKDWYWYIASGFAAIRVDSILFCSAPKAPPSAGE